ncbi:MAG: ribonuclease E inhibitor RraB, partial [Bryobacterales bacterium]|nr:ribonuclease E inhibitor RraB [Bryobacterales bacterium]
GMVQTGFRNGVFSTPISSRFRWGFGTPVESGRKRGSKASMILQGVELKSTVSKKSIVEELNSHRERNRELQKTFSERQIDLNEPRPIEFHFWSWTQRDAAMLGRSLYEMGFLIRLLAPAPEDNDPDRWAVEAGAKLPLAQALSDKLTRKLIELADAEDAIFDGWGTSV